MAMVGCVDRCPEPVPLVLSQRNTVEVHIRKEIFDVSLKLQSL